MNIEKAFAILAFVLLAVAIGFPVGYTLAKKRYYGVALRLGGTGEFVREGETVYVKMGTDDGTDAAYFKRKEQDAAKLRGGK